VRRLDFLGVPGVGKTTTYNLLREIRQSRNEFLFFEEAYHKVIITRLRNYHKVGGLFRRYYQKHPSSQRYFASVNSWLDVKLNQARLQIEKANYLDSIHEMGEKHPVFLQLTLEGIGRQKIIPSKMAPSDYFDSLIKITNRLNQFCILQKYFCDDTMIVFDSSFSHKVFSIVDFSREVDQAIISQYFEAMPQPSIVAVFNLPAAEVVNRIRNRAREGYANAWHRPIVNTKLLESWVEFACEVAYQARMKLLDLGIPVIDLDANQEPVVLAGQIRDEIIHLKLK
jgi:thymidylate kinase